MVRYILPVLSRGLQSDFHRSGTIVREEDFTILKLRELDELFGRVYGGAMGTAGVDDVVKLFCLLADCVDDFRLSMAKE